MRMEDASAFHEGVRAASTMTLSMPEVATYLGVSQSLVYDLAKRDELPVKVIRLGRRMVVSRAALMRVLDSDGTELIDTAA